MGYNRIGFGCENAALAARSKKKWFPCNKGGSYRKWYGNQDYIINWYHDGYDIKNFRDNNGKQRSVIRNPQYYFQESISWSSISSTSGIAFRYYPTGFIFDHAACNLYGKDTNSTLVYLNTKLVSLFSNIINPTLNLFSGALGNIPYLKISGINYYAEQNIAISKQDWDAHETSWDFQRNELLSIDTSTYTENIDYKIEKHFEETGEHISLSPAAPQLGSLEWRMEQYKTKWERKFMQLHKNEEELNCQFIDIYGLQDELTPDVPLNEITILQQGEISIE